MYIKSARLINFRNYTQQEAGFENGLNVIYGRNAAGKTNLLESLYYAGIGKSAKTSNEKEIVQWDKDFCYIKLEIVKQFYSHILEIHFDKKGKKRIAIDGIPLAKIGDLVGYLNIVYFSPDEMRLIKESPQERRRFMDISLSQQKKAYLFALMRYNRILSQRNKLIKSGTNIQQTIPIWDIQLSKEAATVIRNRYEFIEELKKHAADKHAILSLGKEKLKLCYECSFGYAEQKELESNILKALTESRDKDLYLGYTTVGPHRDDMDIIINEVSVKKYGSQGQQRTAALSLKLAEIDVFQLKTGEKPVLLLDDVLSELDEYRKEKLLEAATGLQTILTCTEYDAAVKAKKYIYIEEGKISEK